MNIKFFEKKLKELLHKGATEKEITEYIDDVVTSYCYECGENNDETYEYWFDKLYSLVY